VKEPWIGTSVRRKEDERLLRGLAAFGDDQDAPGTLHMAVGRSPYPHTRIASIDAREALAMAGVHGVLVGRDVVPRTNPIEILRPLPDIDRVPDYHAMAVDVAVFEGQPVVSVVAVDRYTAEDALERIDIDYEPLPHVTDTEAALASDAPRLHSYMASNLLVRNPRSAGDVDAAFARADVVLQDRFAINRVTGLPLEGRAIWARYTPGLKTLEVRVGSQTPHLTRMQLARCLRLPEARIRVVASEMGGGFGLKIGLYPEDILACLHSLDLGRPVQWVEDRMEHFRATSHSREAVHRTEMAATRDGRILGLRNVYTIDCGAFNAASGGPPMLSSLMAPGPYRIADAYIERRVALTNKTPYGAYRGYGQPESNFVRELLVDRLARRIGADPLEVRRKNFLRPEDMPWKSAGGAVYDSGDYQRCLDLAASRIGYESFRPRQQALRAEGRYVGVGFSCYVEMTGYISSAFLGKHGARYGAFESVTIRMNRSGGATLLTGVSTFGQGTDTTFSQVCASTLGIDPADITVLTGDTADTPYSVGSFASRTTIAGSGAVQRAALEVRAKMLRIAAHLLGVKPERLEIVNGVVRHADDPSVQITVAEVATEANFGHRMPPGDLPGLEATAYFDPNGSAFAYGTAAAIVDVDPRTGEFRIERFVLVHDCGTQINPMLVEGQVHGGIAQALGAALYEELVYNAETGQLINGTMLDYFVPTAADLPRFELDHTEVPSPVTPYGVRGIGESGTIPPGAAVANAICDALSPFGVEINRLPLTAESIWRALESARARHS
jgi:carbon-monoxide dehydrogenase large subunit